MNINLCAGSVVKSERILFGATFSSCHISNQEYTQSVTWKLELRDFMNERVCVCVSLIDLNAQVEFNHYTPVHPKVFI